MSGERFFFFELWNTNNKLALLTATKGVGNGQTVFQDGLMYSSSGTAFLA